MQEVLSPGDVVLVRALPGKLPPAALARAGKPIPLALEQVPRLQGALVAIDPRSRGVRALVGGYDFQVSQFNRALQARRQPGSAFKPFVWGAAIESRRFTPATVVYDTPDVYRDPWTGKDWKPHNFERDVYEGPMMLEEALAQSKNTVSAKLLDSMGVEPVLDFARRAGIDEDLPHGLALALGTGEVTPIELVNAYATIAAGGKLDQPVLVLRVRDRNGEILEEHIPESPPPEPVALAPVAVTADGIPTAGETATPIPTPTATSTPTEVEPPPRVGMNADVAFVLTSMMRGVVEYGTGQAARALGRPAAAKTGTAQDHRDAWFAGFTPELVAGVWVGFDSHDPMGPKETGSGAALPAWLSFMQAALEGKPPGAFAAPPRVEVARIDRRTGLLAPPGAPAEASPFVAFLAGTAPTRSSAEAPEPGTAPQTFFQDDR
jgi:penicillin-binding protein 1A